MTFEEKIEELRRQGSFIAGDRVRFMTKEEVDEYLNRLGQSYPLRHIWDEQDEEASQA